MLCLILKFSQQDDLGVNQMTEEPEQGQKNLTSAPEAAAPSIPGSTARVKRLTFHEKLALEFHERKMQYLKEEHELKMRILQVELSVKEMERDMKQQQLQNISVFCNNAPVDLVPL